MPTKTERRHESISGKRARLADQAVSALAVPAALRLVRVCKFSYACKSKENEELRKQLKTAKASEAELKAQIARRDNLIDSMQDWTNDQTEINELRHEQDGRLMNLLVAQGKALDIFDNLISTQQSLLCLFGERIKTTSRDPVLRSLVTVAESL